ncbi:DNA-binding transcriptional MerR regulator [Actinocorallia herbida]|uniref:DNA-binding transcriptional MerR regulator n=1 Tax=Actinocorallia herbida TaxID=58109 RepID=A0A3N1CU94_9ACTN|nr:MerR family transcriptional regulator [Actinocorallia herbida]ROO84882.1 DNA-binding transcriptional MerR regulator [Actinocorallia herbida]
MRIGELSRETGVAVRLLRYYEEQDLLSSQRTDGGHRLYAPDAPETVARIRALLAAGLPTRVIRDLMPCFAPDGATLQPCVLDHLAAQAADLDTRIAGLTSARTALTTLLTASTHAATALPTPRA